MKVLLVAINSKFSHTNIAVRLLSRYAKCGQVMEFTINEQPSFIISEIYREKPDILCFSAYIWNIEIAIKCAETLKHLLPDTKIIFGGPEVSYDTEDFLKAHGFADAVMTGEGEETYKTLCENGFDFDNAHGIAYEKAGEIITVPQKNNPVSLDDVPFPYTDEELNTLADKLLYYESSRGCPYNCTYCLSSTIHSLRFAKLDKVKRDLKKFIDSKVRIVKFIDRTFNADCKRAYEIFEFLINNADKTRFHFEISAHILSAEILTLLKTAPKGLFQFEIGVQSTNPDTISAINRNTDFDVLKKNVETLLSYGNIHIHLDLIAGLPYENLESFRKSFNEVFAVKPDMLQLGFLKLLKGTAIRQNETIHDYKYISYPPYEFTANKYMSFDDVLELKAVENVLDKYYNSEKFRTCTDRLLTFFDTPYDMFKALAQYFSDNGYDKISLSQNTLYSILAEFVNMYADKLTLEKLAFDYYHLANSNTAPVWHNPAPTGEIRHKIIEENRETIFAGFSGMPTKEILKHTIFAQLEYNVLTNAKTPCIAVFFKNGKYGIIPTI